MIFIRGRIYAFLVTFFVFSSAIFSTFVSTARADSAAEFQMITADFLTEVSLLQLEESGIMADVPKAELTGKIKVMAALLSQTQKFTSQIFTALTFKYPDVVLFDLVARVVRPLIVYPIAVAYGHAELIPLLVILPDSELMDVGYFYLRKWKEKAQIRARYGYTERQLNHTLGSLFSAKDINDIDLQMIELGSERVLLPIYKKVTPHSYGHLTTSVLESIVGQPEIAYALKNDATAKYYYREALLMRISIDAEKTQALFDYLTGDDFIRGNQMHNDIYELMQIKKAALTLAAQVELKPRLKLFYNIEEMKTWAKKYKLKSRYIHLARDADHAAWELAKARIDQDEVVLQRSNRDLIALLKKNLKAAKFVGCKDLVSRSN
jgi:hypothetical protein